MMIYIREAHPTDKWWLAETKFMMVVAKLFNDLTSYEIPEPVTADERRGVARACRDKLLGDMPVYVDDMDNRVDLAYVGWPTRVYVLDKEGRVNYDSGLGPYGLSHDELEKNIAAYLAESDSHP
jgi:hypothetical protein